LGAVELPPSGQATHRLGSTVPWAYNLGPAAKVAEVLSQRLASIDYDESSAAS